MGGGLGIAMRADLRIAASDATFGIPAARLGLAYAFESLRALTDLVGPANAKEILFTARRLDAAEALRIGLVNRVVAPDEIEATVRAWAREISDNAPLTIEASKTTVNELMKDETARDLEQVETLNRRCMDSQDYAEGRRAFKEKRKPNFIGR